MALTQSANKTITLKGSADIVSEFFDYGINSILYQRGIYPSESFVNAEKYGVRMLMTNNNELKEFLSNVLKQLHEWLVTKELQRVNIVISPKDTLETIECWEFKIENEDEVTKPGKQKQKDIKEIQEEIKNIIRQITSTVTFLPLLDMPCSFDVQCYTRRNTKVPEKWADTVPDKISDFQEVRFRTFSTSIHKVDTCVFYKGGGN